MCIDWFYIVVVVVDINGSSDTNVFAVAFVGTKPTNIPALVNTCSVAVPTAAIIGLLILLILLFLSDVVVVLPVVHILLLLLCGHDSINTRAASGDVIII